MRKIFTTGFSLLVLIMMIGMLTSELVAQTVNVKVRCNTSTCLDTLRSNHLVLIAGESKLGTTPTITWNDTPGLTNVGGDYWETTFAALPGDTIHYQFVTKFDASTGTAYNWGWEGPITNESTSRTLRVLVVGNNDTTLAIQYYNGSATNRIQYWKPYTIKPDSVAVYFRVNMAGETGFNPETQVPAIYGGLPLGAESWIKIIDLTRETGSRNGAFWSGVAYIAKSSVGTYPWQNYKFVYDNGNVWETGGNRYFQFTNNTVDVTGDTTINWVYFSNKAPVVGEVTTVNVTFRCNTSTCLDTLQPTHIVGINGESVKGIDGLVWGSGSPTLKMTNVGGDYWETTLKVQPGDVIHYKFITKYDDATMSAVNWGWEGDFNNGYDSWTSRASVIGINDTILPLQYYNGGTTVLNQYWMPLEKKQDTVAVYFRVNMGGVIFNPATQTVEVRGGAPFGTDDPWIKIIDLTREVNSVNGGSFWSGVAYVPKANVTVGARQQYQFVYRSPETWESSGNRSFFFSDKVINVVGDTTIHWKYFSNFAPSGPIVNADILFSLKLQALEKAGLFNRNLGDKIAVTGAKGWPPSNFNPLTDFDTTSSMLKMTYNPDDKVWERVESFTKYPNEVITYKYYIAWDSTRVNPASPNYIPGLLLSDGWEEPGVTGGADRKYIYTDQVNQIIPGDFGSGTQFFNSLHWKGAITNPIQVTFTIDMAPAADAASNPNTLFRPGVDTVFIQFDGSLAAVTQGKSVWGTDNRLILSDLDGDGKYTYTWNMQAPTLYQLCYRVVYSSPGVDGGIRNGSNSAIPGRRYYQYIHPVQVKADSAIWPASYTLAEMPWMLDSLTNEVPPDLETVTSVGNNNDNNPETFALYQNYPNPFNPSTVITYTVPVKAQVQIEIFNLLGQKVVSLFNHEQSAGTHSLTWNGRDSRNNTISSGVYFLKMQAGSFSQVKKMLLTK